MKQRHDDTVQSKDSEFLERNSSLNAVSLEREEIDQSCANYGSTPPFLAKENFSGWDKKWVVGLVCVLPFLFGVLYLHRDLSTTEINQIATSISRNALSAFPYYQNNNNNNNNNNNPMEFYETSRGSRNRLQKMKEIKGMPTSTESNLNIDGKKPIRCNKIVIDSSIEYQEILGFGGSFTEAASIQFDRLPEKKKKEIIDLYFSEERGIGYTLGRVHINSCDFCVNSYSFDDTVGDLNLSHFDKSVTHDRKTMIPFMKRALKKQPNLNILASPWSPPAWMKLPRDGIYDMNSSAVPNGLNPIYQEVWAKYISKFITAYKEQGINLWGITVQNEPEFAAPWEACTYTPTFMKDFVKFFLGPIVKAKHPEIQIMFYDHNRDHIYDWAKVFYEDQVASSYVSGVAFHWYAAVGNDLEGLLNFDKLYQTHMLNPDKILLSTESCNCPFVATGEKAWFRGESYAHDILNDLNHFAQGWIDWNLMLNNTGGPNHLNNLCDAPIITTEDGLDYKLQPMYYFIGHFSKFIPPGSRRIDSKIQVVYDQPGDPQILESFPGASLHCDGSARQKWNLMDGLLRVDGTNICATNMDGTNVEFWKCRDTDTQRWKMEDGRIINIEDESCLYVDESIPVEATRNLRVGNCSDVQRPWVYDESTKALLFGSECLSAGSAQFESVAFITPSLRKVLVVMNSNNVSVGFKVIADDLEYVTSIPGKSIQTYRW